MAVHVRDVDVVVDPDSDIFFVFLRVEEERLRHSVQEAPKVNSLTRRIGLYMNMVMKMNIMMLLISSCI